MTRMWMYTGNLYTEEDYKEDRIHECCRVLTKEEELNVEKISNLSLELKKIRRVLWLCESPPI